MAKKLTEPEILDALSNVDAPKTGTNIVDAGLVKDLAVSDDSIAFVLVVDPDAPSLSGAVAMSARTALKVAGWKGDIQIRSEQQSKAKAANGNSGERHGPQGPPAEAPRAADATETKGAGLPVVGQKKSAPPKRGAGGLPVVGGSSGGGSAAPPKRGPGGLPVVGQPGPSQGAQRPPGPPPSTTGRVGQGSAMAKKPVPGVKYIIAVASGKGGVGKSTIASNLACALAALGHKTGLLDNDVYGPSAPVMFGITEQPDVADKKLIPIEKYGVKIMSLGFLLDEGAPVIWRGPIVLQVTDQLFYDVNWGELDFLICDLPPGTGDVQLTMAQKVPVTGALIVTTPQDVALADVERGLKMFDRVDVPVLGVVENMATFICPHCDEPTPIFGSGGGKRKAKELKLPYLGDVPIDPSVREWGDKGKPVVIAQPDSSVAQAFKKLAERLVKDLGDEEKGGLAKLTKRVLKIIQ